MYIEQFFVKGLGCMSYLIGCKATGEAAVIDPDRDVQKYLEAAEAEGLHIKLIIETHLHADHVSGNTILAQATDAEIAVHSGATVGFMHRDLHDGEVIGLGNVRLRVSHTPGHTPDSLVVAVSDTTHSDAAWFVLTGDTLFVGDVGRPDLAGKTSPRELALRLHQSLFDVLMRFDSSVIVYPGHGAGSLCGRGIGDTRSTTIGYEGHYNPALQPRTADEFATMMTEHLPIQPANHFWIKQQNIDGPVVIEEPSARTLSAADIRQELAAGAALLDLRSAYSRQSLALAGVAWLEPEPGYANRLGFAVPVQQPVILILDDPETYHDHAMMLHRVGFNRVIGYVQGGKAAAAAAGLTTYRKVTRTISASQLAQQLDSAAPPVVVDVREEWEYNERHVPGAVNIPLAQLASRVDELPLERPLAVICEGGSRSQAGAAVLDRFAKLPVLNVEDGTSGWFEMAQQSASGTSRAK